MAPKTAAAAKFSPSRFGRKRKKNEDSDSDEEMAQPKRATPKGTPTKRKKATKRIKKGARKKLKVSKAAAMKSVDQTFKAEQKRITEKQAKAEVTVKSLNLKQKTREVEILNEDSVRRNIELVFFNCLKTIMAGQGLQYKVPSRSSSNQIYVPELDRIVLKDVCSTREFASTKNARKTAITTRILGLIYETCAKEIHITKRDLFYTDVKLFKDQGDSDKVLEDVATMLGATRTSLNVIASPKGVVVGCLQFNENGDEIDCQRLGIGGKAITAIIDRVTNIRGTAKFILLVEKDAAFNRLSEDRFYNDYPCILLTAKGQPDVATRMFLRKITMALKIPVLGLVDADPYGLKILSVYMSGSKNMSYDSAHLTTSNIKWLGVRPSDLDKLGIPEQCRLPMTEGDIKTGKDLLKEDFIQQNPKWVKELEWMIENKVKAEIQALSSFDLQYLTKEYLPRKLLDKDWI